MKRINILIWLLFLISCKKGNDIYNYTINYDNPTPKNGASDISIRQNFIGFNNIGQTGLAQYDKAYYVYFDTVYPPENRFEYTNSQVKSKSVGNLLPNKLYCWNYSILIPIGEIKSDIETFETESFDGNWKLDSVADKRGYIEWAYPNGLPQGVNWTDWSSESLEFVHATVGTGGMYHKYFPNMDSLINAEADIDQLNIFGSSAQIELHNTNNFMQASFSYNASNFSTLIQELQSRIEHYFITVNVGYIASYNKVVLLMMNEKGIMFIYSRQ